MVVKRTAEPRLLDMIVIRRSQQLACVNSNGRSIDSSVCSVVRLLDDYDGPRMSELMR
jgi:hypothetical protein